MGNTHKLGTPRKLNLRVRDAAGRPVRARLSEFSVQIFVDDALVNVPFSITEVEYPRVVGRFSLVAQATTLGEWEIFVSHPTYNRAGWQDSFRVVRRGIDDLAFPATSGASLESLLVKYDARIVSSGVAGYTANATSFGVDPSDPAYGSGPPAYSGCIVILRDPTWPVPQTRIVQQWVGFYTIQVDTLSYFVSPNGTTTYQIFGAYPQGIDWSRTTNPGALLDLSNTTIKGIDSGVTITGSPDVNVAKWLGSVPNALQFGRVDSYAGAMAAGVIGAGAFAANALGATWDELATGHVAAGSFGERMGSLVVRNGTAQAGGAFSITLDAGASATDNLYRWQLCVIRSGTGAGQCRWINTYTGSTKAATVSSPWQTQPDNTSVFVLLPATAVGIDGSNSFGAVPSNVAQWNGSSPNNLVSGNVLANVKAVTAGALAGETVAAALSTGDVTGNIAGSLGGDVLGKVLGGGVGAITGVGAQVDKTGYSLSAAGVQSIWDALTSALTTAGSIGKRLADDIDATVSSRLASASYTTPPSVASIAAAILANPANLLATDTSGRVTIGSIVASAIDATQITVGAAQFLADQLLDRANSIETALTVRKALRGIFATGVNRVTGMEAGLPVFNSGGVDRVKATVDGDGNRTAVDLSGL